MKPVSWEISLPKKGIKNIHILPIFSRVKLERLTELVDTRDPLNYVVNSCISAKNVKFYSVPT